MLINAIDALLAEFAKAQNELDHEQARLDRKESAIADTSIHPDYVAANEATQRAYQDWCSLFQSTIVPALLDAGLSQHQIDHLSQGIHDELEGHVESILSTAQVA